MYGWIYKQTVIIKLNLRISLTLAIKNMKIEYARKWGNVFQECQSEEKLSFKFYTK